MQSYRRGAVFAVWVGAVLAVGAGSGRAAALEVGAKAPGFSLPGSDGDTHSLEQHGGQRGVVLAWFPKAFTPGWTQELSALRDSALELARFEAAVYMISLDDAEKNRAFAESLNAAHVLLSDTGGTVAQHYGVTSLGGLYARRWVFYIDAGGTVRFIDKDVNTETAGQDIATRLKELGFPTRKRETAD